MSEALLTALAMTTLFGAIGWALKNLLWDRTKKPLTASDFGRKFASNVAFIAALTSVHQFIKKDFAEAVVSFIVAIVFFPLVAYFIGYIFGMINKGEKGSEPSRENLNDSGNLIASNSILKNVPKVKIHEEIMIPQESTAQKSVDENEEAIWAQALTELENGNKKTGLWAKAFAESLGDENKAKALYLKMRFSEIKKIELLEKQRGSQELTGTDKTADDVNPIVEGEAQQVMEDTDAQRKRKLLNQIQKSVQYEDAVSLLEEFGFKVEIKKSGFLSPLEYEVWDVKAGELIFKAISKGLILQFTREKFINY